MPEKKLEKCAHPGCNCPAAKNSTHCEGSAGRPSIACNCGQITGVDRKPLKLKEDPSLVLGGLQGDPHEDDPRIVSLEPEAASVKVDPRGSSNSILLDKSNEAATPAEYLSSQKLLATYLSNVALIGSTILAILTRLKVIRYPTPLSARRDAQYQDLPLSGLGPTGGPGRGAGARGYPGNAA